MNLVYLTPKGFDRALRCFREKGGADLEATVMTRDGAIVQGRGFASVEWTSPVRYIISCNGMEVSGTTYEYRERPGWRCIFVKDGSCVADVYDTLEAGM